MADKKVGYNYKLMFWSKELNKKMLCKWGIGGGLAEVAYIILVGGLMTGLGSVMPKIQPEFLAMITVLTLFVLSAGLSGLFVFGYPVYLALQKQYKEALWTIIVTFATILICFLSAIFIAIIISKY